MRYINDPNSTAISYADLVKKIIKHGIEPNRAYIYLAGLGIRGEFTRVFNHKTNDYSRPIKYAVNAKDQNITSVTTCDHCKSIQIA